MKKFIILAMLILSINISAKSNSKTGNSIKENTKNIPFQEYPQGTYLVLLSYTNGDQKSISILKK